MEATLKPARSVESLCLSFFGFNPNEKLTMKDLRYLAIGIRIVKTLIQTLIFFGVGIVLYAITDSKLSDYYGSDAQLSTITFLLCWAGLIVGVFSLVVAAFLFYYLIKEIIKNRKVLKIFEE